MQKFFYQEKNWLKIFLREGTVKTMGDVSCGRSCVAVS
jgi:hypothetical protein